MLNNNPESLLILKVDKICKVFEAFMAELKVKLIQIAPSFIKSYCINAI